MKAKKVNKGFSKIKKIAEYVATLATVGAIITHFIRKKKTKG